MGPSHLATVLLVATALQAISWVVAQHLQRHTNHQKALVRSQRSGALNSSQITASIRERKWQAFLTHSLGGDPWKVIVHFLTAGRLSDWLALLEEVLEAAGHLQSPELITMICLAKLIFPPPWGTILAVLHVRELVMSMGAAHAVSMTFDLGMWPPTAAAFWVAMTAKHACAFMKPDGNRLSIAPGFTQLLKEHQDELMRSLFGTFKEYAGCMAGANTAAVLGVMLPSKAAVIAFALAELSRHLKIEPDEVLSRMSDGEVASLEDVPAVLTAFRLEVHQPSFKPGKPVWRCSLCPSLRYSTVKLCTTCGTNASKKK